MASLGQLQLPQEHQLQLDELYLLLRAQPHTSEPKCANKQRAIDIIAGLAPGVLFEFMQQLASAAPEQEPPDSPQRLAPVADQQLSPCPQAAKADSSPGDLHGDPQQDIQQPSDSLLQPPTMPEHTEQQLQQRPSGRCFLAESLDLNLGASYDCLAKASLADFSSAAAAARLSTTGLMRQSNMHRVLSPVAEASFLSATADAQQDYSDDGSTGCEPLASQHQALHQHYGSHAHQQQQVQQDAVPQPQHQLYSHGGVRPAPAGCVPPAIDLSPSNCSSPTESPCTQPRSAASTAAVRKSVAESAYDWPNSQPLPFMMCEADAEEVTPVHYTQTGIALNAPQAMATAQLVVAGQQQHQQQHYHHHNSSSPYQPTAGSCSSGSSSNNSGPAAKRGGGPIRQVLKAPLSVANALRRSITGLTGGKGAGAASSTKAQHTAPLKAGNQRSLACASAPMASVYGAAAGARSPGMRQQATSPGLHVQRALPSFTANKHQGSSPSKAAASAAAASARKQAAVPSGSSSTPQRMAVSTGYKPPGAASMRGAAGGAAGRSTPGKDTAALASRRAPSGSTATGQPVSHIPGVTAAAGGGCSSSSSQMQWGSTGPNSRLASQQQQQQQRADASRPSSQASVMSYRSDRSAAGTGSHTSGGGALPTFDTTRQMLQANSAQKGKQQQSRLHKPGVGSLAAAAAAQQQRALNQQAAVDARGSSRIPRQMVGGLHVPQSKQQQGFGGKAGATADPRALLAHQQQQQQQALRQLQHGVLNPRQQQQQLPGSTSGASAAGMFGGGGSNGSRSRVAAGAPQLRRSRSCGSLSELVNVADVRHMWQQREAQEQHDRRAAREHCSTAVAAADTLQAHRSHSHGQLHAGETSPHRRQHGALLPAAQGADAIMDCDLDPELPMLSRCQSPTRCPEVSHHQEHTGRGASLVLAQMGNVIGGVEALMADSSTGSSSGHLGRTKQGAAGSSGQAQHGGAALAPAVQSGQLGPHALVKKLLAGGHSNYTAAAGPAGPAANHQAAAGSGAVGHAVQQMLMTPPPKLPGVDGAGAGRLGCGGGHGAATGVCVESEADIINPVSSPDDNPAVSGSSSQVST